MGCFWRLPSGLGWSSLIFHGLKDTVTIIWVMLSSLIIHLQLIWFGVIWLGSYLEFQHLFLDCLLVWVYQMVGIWWKLVIFSGSCHEHASKKTFSFIYLPERVEFPFGGCCFWIIILQCPVVANGLLSSQLCGCKWFTIFSTIGCKWFTCGIWGIIFGTSNGYV